MKTTREILIETLEKTLLVMIDHLERNKSDKYLLGYCDAIQHIRDSLITGELADYDKKTKNQ